MRSLFVVAVLGMFAVACAKDPISDTGGSTGSGGKTETGGSTGSGGKTGNGGVTGSGGKTANGGATGSGGKSANGGATGSGGKSGTGGTSQPGSIDCTDVSTDSFSITDQYGSREVALDGTVKKTYYFMANWWGSPYSGQGETINGLGFTIKSTSSTASSNNNPLGFPTMFIGGYGTRATQGSGMPKQVSSLTSVPTIFSTNVDTKGDSNYNATYDVWLSKTSAGVSGSSPGQGGAYLMVWLFMPSNRRPRGSIVAQGSPVSGIKGGWDIWYDSSTDPPCVSYVSITNLSTLEFDLNYFIQDAVTSKYGVTKDQYLSIIFAGFEVWGGGDGLQVKKFCANVK